MSYPGNWCAKPETPIIPCQRQWLGEGPMENTTINKHSYMWLCADKPDPAKPRNNIYLPCATMNGIIYACV